MDDDDAEHGGEAMEEDKPPTEGARATRRNSRGGPGAPPVPSGMPALDPEEDDDEDMPGMLDDDDIAAVAEAAMAAATAAAGGAGPSAGLDSAAMASALADRVADAARSRGLPPGVASSTMQALLRKLGAGGAAGRAGGPSIEELLGAGFGAAGLGTSGTSARLKTILAGLRAEGDDSAQMDALTQLCEVLSMSHEETLARTFAIDSFVPLLVRLLDAEHNPDAMLLAARALTHLADVFPPARASIVREGALQPLCSRLLNIQYIDLAEQSLQALSKLCIEHGAPCVRAGGLSACLAFLDFFSIGLQRVAVSTAASMCRSLPPDCHAQALDSAPQLTRLLTSEDSKLVEHAAIALSRCASSMSGAPLEQLCTPDVLTQALSLLTPPQAGQQVGAAVTSPACVALVSLLMRAVTGCPSAGKQLLQSGGAGVLAAALRATGACGGMGAHSPGPGSAPAASAGNAAALPAWADLAPELVALFNALLPSVPPPSSADAVGASPGGRASHHGSSRRSPRLSNGPPPASPDAEAPAALPAPRRSIGGKSAVETYAVSLATGCPELVDAMATELLSVLISIASGGPGGSSASGRFRVPAVPPPVVLGGAPSRRPGVDASVGTSLRHRALVATHRLVHYASADGLAGGALVAPHSTASFLAGVLQSSDGTVLMPALQIIDTLLVKAPHGMGRPLVKEGALHALSVIASTSPTAPGAPSAEIIAFAADVRTRHAAALGLGGSSGGGRTAGAGLSSGDDLARLQALCTTLNALADSGAAGQDDSAAEAKGTEALTQLLAALSADGGVSTFEFLEGGVASAVLAYLTVQPTAGGSASSGDATRAALGASRLRVLMHCCDTCAPGARGLVHKLLEALSVRERLPLTPLLTGDRHAGADSGAGVAAAGMAALTRPFKLCLRKDPADKSLRDYSTNIVLVEPLATLAAVEEFLLPRVHVRRPTGAASAVPPEDGGAPPTAPDATAGGPSDAAGAGRRASRHLSSRQRERGPASDGAPPVLPAPAGEVPAGGGTVMDAAPPPPPPVVDGDEEMVEEEEEGVLFDDEDDMDEDEDGGGGGGPADREVVHTVDVVNPSQSQGGGSDGGAAPPKPAGAAAAEHASGATTTSGAAHQPPAFSFAEAAARGAAAPAGDAGASHVNQHLFFSMGGVRCGLQTTLMQAVHAAAAAPAAAAPDGPSSGSPTDGGAPAPVDALAGGVLLPGEEPGSRHGGGNGMWDRVHYLTYRLATPQDGDIGGNPLIGAFGDAAAAALGDELVATWDDAGASPQAQHAGHAQQGHDSAPALRAIWATASAPLPMVLCTSLGDAAARDALALLLMLHRCGALAQHPELFLCQALSNKLSRQLCDAVALSSGSLPAWTVALPAYAPFLFPFDVRRQLFFATALGVPRALHRLQTSYPGVGGGGVNSPGHDAGGAAGRGGPGGGGPAGASGRVARLQRQKVRISRTRVLDSAAKVFTLSGSATSVLEVEFFGEEGTGNGPTLEFYTLLSREFRSKKINIWRTGDEPSAGGAKPVRGSGAHAISAQGSAFSEAAAPASIAAAGDEDALAEADLVCTRHGLFPAPLPPDAAPDEVSRVCGLFTLLGRASAKAIQDGRLLDVPLSGAFYKAMQGRQLTHDDVASFDPGLGSTLKELAALAESSAGAGPGHSVTLHGVPVQDLCLTFTVPGQPGYALCPGGADITVSDANLSPYVASLTDALVGAGVARQMDALRTGFAEVCAPASLRVFSPTELESLLCGAGETWTPELLAECLRFDHGYTVRSPPVQALMTVLSEMSAAQQQQFLKFVTGAPRLPPGGLAALRPRLTIVCKHPSGAAAAAAMSTSAGRAGLALGTTAADGDLPSAMTCANYLKLPPYSSRMALKERLLYAINEGTGSFLLS